jgi:hypothetical protein
MIIKITGLERSERETKSGVQTGIKVSGTKLKDGVDDGPWDRFFADQFDSTIIQGLEQIGVGGTADLKMERKEGTKFWNAVSVRPYLIGGGKAAVQQVPAVKAVAVKVAESVSAGGQTLIDLPDATPEEKDGWRRQEALDQALKLSVAAIHAGSFKKGTTFDLLTIETLGAAEAFDRFLSGDGTVPEPDATAVEEGAEDSETQDEEVVF